MCLLFLRVFVIWSGAECVCCFATLLISSDMKRFPYLLHLVLILLVLLWWHDI